MKRILIKYFNSLIQIQFFSWNWCNSTSLRSLTWGEEYNKLRNLLEIQALFSENLLNIKNSVRTAYEETP